MKGTHRYTKIAFIWIFIFLLSSYIFSKVEVFILDRYIFSAVLILGPLIVAEAIDYHLDVFSKPVISSKAKVISKRIYKRWDRRYATFLFADKTTCELELTKKQYNSININDIVNLEYQSYIVNSVEKISKDKTVNSKGNK